MLCVAYVPIKRLGLPKLSGAPEHLVCFVRRKGFDRVHYFRQMNAGQRCEQYMQTGADKFGMQTLNQSLAALYRKRSITLDTALSVSSNGDELKELCGRSGGSGFLSNESFVYGSTA